MRSSAESDLGGGTSEVLRVRVFERYRRCRALYLFRGGSGHGK